MPNLSPADVRQNYLLYDNKLCSGAEAAEAKNDLAARLHSIGYEIAEAAVIIRSPENASKRSSHKYLPCAQ